LFANFHQIWQLAAATNAKQCVLKLPTSYGVCTHTHYFVMLLQTEL